MAEHTDGHGSPDKPAHDHDQAHLDNQAHDQAHGHDEVRVEESSLSNRGIVFFFAVTAFVFFGSAAALGSSYYKITDVLLREKSGGSTSADLTAQRALEEERLNSYGYQDKNRQIVRMPIDVAMQKVVEDAKK